MVLCPREFRFTLPVGGPLPRQSDRRVVDVVPAEAEQLPSTHASSNSEVPQRVVPFPADSVEELAEVCAFQTCRSGSLLLRGALPRGPGCGWRALSGQRPGGHGEGCCGRFNVRGDSPGSSRTGYETFVPA